MSNFTDQKPRTATEADVNARWAGNPRNFKCYLCGHKFKIGDIWRWVLATHVGLINILVCKDCDGPDALEKWKKHHADGLKRFWWMDRG